MGGVVCHDEIENDVTALLPASPGTTQLRCNSCGLEWESTHCAEICPLRELELALLCGDWLIIDGEGPG